MSPLQLGSSRMWGMNGLKAGVLNDVENLTQERIDEVLNEFLRDFDKGSLESKGWPQLLAAYTVSKAAMNGCTRILAKKNPTFRVNSVCPGYVRTDLNYRTWVLTVEEGAECALMAALLPRDGPSGLFFVKKQVSSFEEYILNFESGDSLSISHTSCFSSL